MPKLPLRILGFIALSIAVTIASCSAFVRSAKGPSETPGTEQVGGETS